MAERYLHFEVAIEHRTKQGRHACGDTASALRTERETTVIVCDGGGSGTAAYVASSMCRSRLENLLSGGFSLHEAFLRLAPSMEQYKQPGQPYAAFTVVQLRNDGHALIMGYESPAAIWVTPRQAQPLPMRPFVHGGAAGYESSCYLRSGEGLLLVTDGITQAGLGVLPGGWQISGAAEYINHLLHQQGMADLPQHIQRKAAALNNNVNHDDATAAWILCRPARPLNILTGPPADKTRDAAVVARFMSMPGPKVTCGATTAAIVARVLGRKLDMEKEPTSLISPPKYLLDGIELMTEGVVTLNQLNNVLELDAGSFYEISAVTELYDFLMASDRIHIFLGTGQNPANKDTCFVQRGVLSRKTIIPLIADKLRRQGKCVIIETL